jgi:hypothetical protein
MGDPNTVISRTPPTEKLAALPLPHWIAEPTTGKRVNLYAKGDKDATAVHASDLQQRGLATCFAIGGLAAIIRSHPNPDAFLRDMITDNKDGTYTVTFFDLHADGSRTTRAVTVNTDFYARPTTSDDANEWWPAIVEKAYVKAYGTDGKIKEGNPGTAMEHFTGLSSVIIPMAEKPNIPTLPGVPAPQLPTLSLEGLAVAKANGYATTFLTFDRNSTGFNQPAYQEDVYQQMIQPHHTYVVTDVNVQAGTVTVRNPWDQKEDIVIPYKEVEKLFTQAQINPVKHVNPPDGVPPYPQRH